MQGLCALDSDMAINTIMKVIRAGDHSLQTRHTTSFQELSTICNVSFTISYTAHTFRGVGEVGAAEQENQKSMQDRKLVGDK